MNRKKIIIALILGYSSIHCMDQSKKRKSSELLTIHTYSKKARSLEASFFIDPKLAHASTTISRCLTDGNSDDQNSNTIDIEPINTEQWELIAPLLVLLQNNRADCIPKNLPTNIHGLALLIKAAKFLNIPDILDPACKKAFTRINLKKFLERPTYLTDCHQRYKADEILVELFNGSPKKERLIQWIRHRLLRTTKTNENTYQSFVLSHDGTKMFTISQHDPNLAMIRDVKTGNSKLHLSMSNHSNAINTVAWSPDGAMLITGAHEAILWDTTTGEPQAIVAPDQATIAFIAWSPDSKKFILCYNDGLGAVYNREFLDFSYSIPLESPHSLAWSPDNKKIIAGFNNLTIFNATSGATLITLTGDQGAFVARAWSADSSKIATGSYDKSAKIWDANTGECLMTLKGHTSTITSIAWSPDNTVLATGSYDKTTRLWNTQTGNCIAVLQGHSQSVLSLAWSPDGKRLATSSSDKTTGVWDTKDGKLLTFLQGHTKWISKVAWTADGSAIITGAWDHKINTWRTNLTKESDLQLKYLSLEQGLFLSAVYEQFERNPHVRLAICSTCQPHLPEIHKSLTTEIQKTINPHIQFFKHCEWCSQDME